MISIALLCLVPAVNAVLIAPTLSRGQCRTTADIRASSLAAKFRKEYGEGPKDFSGPAKDMIFFDGLKRDKYTTLTDEEQPPLEMDIEKYFKYQLIAKRNDNYPDMTRIAAFANSIYGGNNDANENSGKAFSLINGYKLIKQWGEYKMGLYQDQRPESKKYVLSVRGTAGFKDICTDISLSMSDRFPDRLSGDENSLFTKLVEIARDLPSGATLEVTGHSLGGWLCAYMTCMLLMDETHHNVDKKVWQETHKMIKLRDGSGGRQEEVCILEPIRQIHQRVKQGDLKIVCHSFNPAVWQNGKLWDVITREKFQCMENHNYDLFHFYRIANDPIIIQTEEDRFGLRELLRKGAGMNPLEDDGDKFHNAVPATGPELSASNMCTLLEFPDQKLNAGEGANYAIWNHLMLNFLGSGDLHAVRNRFGMEQSYKYFNQKRGHAMEDAAILKRKITSEWGPIARDWASNRKPFTAQPSIATISHSSITKSLRIQTEELRIRADELNKREAALRQKEMEREAAFRQKEMKLNRKVSRKISTDLLARLKTARQTNEQSEQQLDEILKTSD